MGKGQDKALPLPVRKREEALCTRAAGLCPYILDLLPGNGFVEYLLDWGSPIHQDRNLSFENYVLDYMPEAVEWVLHRSGAEELTLFGYCQGGTMSAMYAALFPDGSPTNLVLLATPVDFAPEARLSYVLELPEEPDEAQREMNIEEEASYVLSVKNPERPAPRGAGLGEKREADYPKRLRERFEDLRFIPVDPPVFLNYEGAEVLLIGAAEEVPEDLRMAKSRHAVEPLFGEGWK